MPRPSRRAAATAAAAIAAAATSTSASPSPSSSPPSAAEKEESLSLLSSVRTAILDVLADGVEERGGGGRRGHDAAARVVSSLVRTEYPWVTPRVLAGHLADRRKIEEDGGVTRVHPPAPPGSGAAASAAAAAPKRKRGRPPLTSAAKAKARATPRGGKRRKTDAAAAAPATEPAAATAAPAPAAAAGPAAGATSAAPALPPMPPPESEPEPEPPAVKPRNRGGRPKGSRTINRENKPRGHSIPTAQEKADRDRTVRARDHAALEYNKYLLEVGDGTDGGGEGRRAKRRFSQRLDEIIDAAKRKFGVPAGTVITAGSIRNRVRNGNLVTRRGIKSPMENVEEELLSLANAKLAAMDRQLTAVEGTELANSLVRKYGMEDQIVEFKRRQTYVPLDEDGVTIADRDATSQLGVRYWGNFVKRMGHRLERRKPGRAGPRSPMERIEPSLVEACNQLGRPVRPTEFVRMALEAIGGTEMEREMRDFKVRTLGKTAENSRGELLGPGYYRAFLRRNGDKLVYGQVQRKRGRQQKQERSGEAGSDDDGEAEGGGGGRHRPPFGDGYAAATGGGGAYATSSAYDRLI